MKRLPSLPTLAMLCCGLMLGGWPAMTVRGQQPAPPAGGSPPPAPAGPAFPGSEIFNGTQAFLSNVSVDHADRTYREGDRLSVHFKADREAFLYLLYHQADGSSLLLFPNSARPDNRVPAGQDVKLADSGDKFRIRIQPPLGGEVLQLVARTQPIGEFDALTKIVGTPVVSKELLAKVRDELLKDRSNWSEHRLPITTVAPAAPAKKKEPAIFALLVGTDRYQDPAAAPPQAPFASAPLHIGRALAQRAGLQPEHVKALSGDQATRANFQDGVTNWLAQSTAPGDTVLIAFTGYAGEFPLAAGADGKPSTEMFLIPHDNAFPTPPQSREQAETMFRERMIFETTWTRWLQALPGRKIILVLDLYRAAMPNSAPQPAGSAPLSDAAMARLMTVPHTEVAVLLAWSLPQAEYFAPGQPPGSWTSAWLSEALNSLPAPVTLGQAFQQVRSKWLAKFTGSGPTVAPFLLMNTDEIKTLKLVPTGAAVPAAAPATTAAPPTSTPPAAAPANPAPAASPSPASPPPGGSPKG